MVKIRPSRAPVKRRCRTDAWQHQPDVLRNNGSMPKPALAAPVPATHNNVRARRPALAGGLHTPFPVVCPDEVVASSPAVATPPRHTAHQHRPAEACARGCACAHTPSLRPSRAPTPTRRQRCPDSLRHQRDTLRNNVRTRRAALDGPPVLTHPQLVRVAETAPLCAPTRRRRCPDPRHHHHNTRRNNACACRAALVGPPVHTHIAHARRVPQRGGVQSCTCGPTCARSPPLRIGRLARPDKAAAPSLDVRCM
ncbi:hypothetical protein GGX14DRAFT_558303 [Mycena pura]|uniref:Uncharacterized protein n=1 Tax=Mycena pura TaxID=153505 RepID=A0AAD6YID3_9AGAR|nr:hypothetical protein GGX14DRAFT_558303 [Mycena pura]